MLLASCFLLLVCFVRVCVCVRDCESGVCVCRVQFVIALRPIVRSFVILCNLALSCPLPCLSCPLVFSRFFRLVLCVVSPYSFRHCHYRTPRNLPCLHSVMAHPPPKKKDTSRHTVVTWGISCHNSKALGRRNRTRKYQKWNFEQHKRKFDVP